LKDFGKATSERTWLKWIYKINREGRDLKTALLLMMYRLHQHVGICQAIFSIYSVKMNRSALLNLLLFRQLLISWLNPYNVIFIDKEHFTGAVFVFYIG
jgi:hypothetical protein